MIVVIFNYFILFILFVSILGLVMYMCCSTITKDFHVCLFFASRIATKFE